MSLQHITHTLQTRRLTCLAILATVCSSDKYCNKLSISLHSSPDTSLTKNKITPNNKKKQKKNRYRIIQILLNKQPSFLASDSNYQVDPVQHFIFTIQN